MPIFRFKYDEEAVKLANDSEYGLAAYFFTKVGAENDSWMPCHAMQTQGTTSRLRADVDCSSCECFA